MPTRSPWTAECEVVCRSSRHCSRRARSSPVRDSMFHPYVGPFSGVPHWPILVGTDPPAHQSQPAHGQDSSCRCSLVHPMGRNTLEPNTKGSNWLQKQLPRLSSARKPRGRFMANLPLSGVNYFSRSATIILPYRQGILIVADHPSLCRSQSVSAVTMSG